MLRLCGNRRDSHGLRPHMISLNIVWPRSVHAALTNSREGPSMRRQYPCARGGPNSLRSRPSCIRHPFHASKFTPAVPTSIAHFESSTKRGFRRGRRRLRDIFEGQGANEVLARKERRVGERRKDFYARRKTRHCCRGWCAVQWAGSIGAVNGIQCLEASRSRAAMLAS